MLCHPGIVNNSPQSFGLILKNFESSHLSVYHGAFGNFVYTRVCRGLHPLVKDISNDGLLCHTVVSLSDNNIEHSSDFMINSFSEILNVRFEKTAIFWQMYLRLG